jgi:hypothetical protein
VSKYCPVVGDTGVIGTVGHVYRNPLCSATFFNAAITANGYVSIQMEKYPPEVQLQFCCPFVREGINDGDTVTADILELNGVAYAFNLEKIS